MCDDLELNTHAFALAQSMMPVLAHRMAELQPLEFNLTANTPRKIKPYQRFARNNEPLPMIDLPLPHVLVFKYLILSAVHESPSCLV